MERARRVAWVGGHVPGVVSPRPETFGSFLRQSQWTGCQNPRQPPIERSPPPGASTAADANLATVESTDGSVSHCMRACQVAGQVPCLTQHPCATHSRSRPRSAALSRRLASVVTRSPEQAQGSKTQDVGCSTVGQTDRPTLTRECAMTRRHSKGGPPSSARHSQAIPLLWHSQSHALLPSACHPRTATASCGTSPSASARTECAVSAWPPSRPGNLWHAPPDVCSEIARARPQKPEWHPLDWLSHARHPSSPLETTRCLPEGAGSCPGRATRLDLGQFAQGIGC